MTETKQPAPACRAGRLRLLVNIAAACFMIQVAFAVFGIPGGLTRWLRGDDVPKQGEPGWIIILGGSGVPSPDTLMRAYYGAQCALAYPQAQCIVALPALENPLTSSPGRMRDELVIRGVPAARVTMEYRGGNTHEQAVGIAKIVGPSGRRQPVTLVTSPYHMRRAYLCLRKAGFEQVNVLPAHSTASNEDYRNAVESWSGFGNPRNLIGNLRYAFWSNLSAQVWILRELIGLASYKIRGWI